MKLLNLEGGRTSLEFAPSEFEVIKSGLKAVAGRKGYTTREEATYDVVVIDGVELISMDEWDEPCLISTSEQGDRILQRLRRVASRPIDLPSGKRNSALAA